MNGVARAAQAGTLESCDIMVLVSPAEPGAGLSIELESPAKRQYGRRILEVITESLAAAGVRDAAVHANDHGALDCTIRARMETALARATAPALAAPAGGAR